MGDRSEESNNGVATSMDQVDSQGRDGGAFGGFFAGGGVLKKGPWTSAEDSILVEYVKNHGEGNWNAVQKHSGLSRCGKSCRLRWANHLRPNLKKGAFAAEEEQKIIELHAKMGNKWAKMASFLPGRTDNEIKNYWNTRIKRRLRAGLPLYPPELSNEDLGESQSNQATSGIDGVDEWQQNDPLQPNNSIPDITFRGYKPDQAVMPFLPNVSQISVRNFTSQGLCSPNYSCLIPGSFLIPAIFHESEPPFPRYASSLQYPNGSSQSATLCGFNFPYDPDTSSNRPALVGILPGCHALPNGNFSASPSLIGNVKSELPSLQYPVLYPSIPPAETEMGCPHATESVQSECVSPRNSGLLDALLHGSVISSHSTNHHLPEKSSSSSIPAISGVDSTTLDTDWNTSDPRSPLGCSATSIFSEGTPNCCYSVEEGPHKIAGTHAKIENGETLEISIKKRKRTQLDLSRPDALLASSWCSNGAKDCLYLWNGMSSACQVSDLP